MAVSSAWRVRCPLSNESGLIIPKDCSASGKRREWRYCEKLWNDGFIPGNVESWPGRWINRYGRTHALVGSGRNQTEVAGAAICWNTTLRIWGRALRDCWQPTIGRRLAPTASRMDRILLHTSPLDTIALAAAAAEPVGVWSDGARDVMIRTDHPAPSQAAGLLWPYPAAMPAFNRINNGAAWGQCPDRLTLRNPSLMPNNCGINATDYGQFTKLLLQPAWQKMGRRKPPSIRRTKSPHGLIRVMDVGRTKPGINTVHQGSYGRRT